ncbi:MAG: hypothetical protein IJZ23_07845 [Roseburia sp.]|nr:hypothetical protein [Roseburia sp.]
MREIIFRAKRVDNGEWVEGFYFCMVHDDGRHVHHFIMPLGADLNLETPIEKIQVEVDVKTTCQYTGLTDKNGNKIWENDIVKAWSEGQCAIGHVKQRIDGHWIMYPAWQNGEMWYLLPNDDGRTTVEIVGNIFDNADLLEG